jgi:hypothetical protein
MYDKNSNNTNIIFSIEQRSKPDERNQQRDAKIAFASEYL